MTNEIKVNISKSTKIIIQAKESDVNLNEPLYAINWFSTKREWLYHFYNFLAVGRVKKVGGAAFFKGKITKTVLDEKNAARSLILIVRYPGGQSFKALLEMTYFKLVSIFRLLSVKDFSFGFTQKIKLDETGVLRDNLCYAVHHFKAESTASFFGKLDTVLADKVKVKYAGKMAAQLFFQKADDPPRALPNLMDGIVIFESKSEDDISKMIKSPIYQSLIEALESSYIGFIKRTI